MRQGQNTTAILWMLGGMASLLTVSVLGVVLGQGYTTFEIMFYRSIIGFLAFLALLVATKQTRKLHFGAWRLHIVRNVIHFTAQNLWFYALAALPLAIVISFEFTTPAWVIIIAALFLGEGFGRRRALVIALSLLGIAIITATREDAAPLSFDPATLAAFAAAIGFALTMITTKLLTKRQGVYEILLMMTFLQAIFAAIIILWQGKLTPMMPADIHWFVLIGIFGTSSHFCITKALSLAPASLVAPIDLVRLPLSILIGAWCFGGSLQPSLFLGAALLISANYLNIVRQA